MNQNMKYADKDGTLATKEEERAALAKIKKIIESLGEGSYLDWAFDGILDLAEENIDNDSALSMKEARDAASAAAQDAMNEYHIAQTLADKRYETIETLKQRITALEDRRDELLKEQDDWSDLTTKQNNEYYKIKEDHDKLRQENLELKAKLYDLMMKEAG